MATDINSWIYTNFVQCFCRMCHPCPRWTSSRPFLPPSYRRVSPRCPSFRGVRVSSSRESRSISWSRLREEQPASPKDRSLSSLCYIWLVQILFSIFFCYPDVIILLFCWSYNHTLCLVVIILEKKNLLCNRSIVVLMSFLFFFETSNN